MSTISLTVIEGSMALPNQRPLGRLPAPFGNDWLLLPPNFSWRAELKALYCALLHTFCMNNEAFLSLCRWAPTGVGRDRAAAAPVDFKHRAGDRARAAIYPTAAGPRAEDAPHATSAAAAAPFADASVFATRARRTPTHWTALTGGAWVLSAGALIAWFAYDHPVQHQPTAGAGHSGAVTASHGAAPLQKPATNSVAARTDAAAADDAARSAPVQARTSAPGPARASADAAARASAETSARTSAEIVARTSTEAVARTSTETLARTSADPSAQSPARRQAQSPAQVSERVAGRATHTPVPAATTDPRAHHAQTSKPTTAQLRDAPRHHVARNAASSARADRLAANGAVRTHAVPRGAQRSKPAPSAAGPFSPYTPAQLGIDEYADITMSSATHLRGFGKGSATMGAASAGKSHPPQADRPTEWMNHIGQRRVTEIPDQFAK